MENKALRRLFAGPLHLLDVWLTFGRQEEIVREMEERSHGGLGVDQQLRDSDQLIKKKGRTSGKICNEECDGVHTLSYQFHRWGRPIFPDLPQDRIDDGLHTA
jgi:hypothetical protein